MTTPRIAFEPEDDRVSRGDRGTPYGFHWTPMRHRVAAATVSEFGTRADLLDNPEDAMIAVLDLRRAGGTIDDIDRIEAIDDERAELEVWHAANTAELEAVQTELANVRQITTWYCPEGAIRSPRTDRAFPTYYAPDGNEPWGGVNHAWLEMRELIEDPRLVAERLEDLGYFALKRLRSQIAQTIGAGRTHFTTRELDVLLKHTVQKARNVGAVNTDALDRVAEQLKLLTSPPTKRVPVTRAAAPMPNGSSTIDLDALFDMPLHAQRACLGRVAEAPVVPDPPAAITVQETLPFTLADVLRNVRSIVTAFEGRHRILVEANKAGGLGRDRDLGAVVSALRRTFCCPPTFHTRLS